MSTLNGSVFRRSVTKSVYNDQVYPERVNGYSTPKQSMAYLEVPRVPSRARTPNQTMNYLEVPRPPSRARSPKISSATEVAAVDPTLEDAQKAGNNYHITMSLNAALAEAGLPPSVAMSTGRTSQMEYATNSRNQMDYTANSRNQMDYLPSSRSVSRIDVYSNATPVPVPAPRLHADNLRNGSVSVIQVAGNEAIGRTVSPYPVIAQRDVVTVVDGYTIKSVQPSTVRKEVHTTVERIPGNNTVGFDLELIGGQTTTIKETIESGSVSGVANLAKNANKKHEGSWETTYTKQRNSERGPEDLERSSTTEKSKKAPIPAGRRPHDAGTDSPDHGSMRDDSHDTYIEPQDFTGNSSKQKPNAGLIGGATKKGYDPNSGSIEGGTKRGYNTNRGPNAGLFGRGAREGSRPHSLDTRSEVRTQREVSSLADRQNPWLLHDDGSDPSYAIYRQLIKGAGPGTVQQRVTVEKDEDDIVEDGPQIKDMLNVDTVSEKVLVYVGNNIAEMTIKVRTERIVPIKGSNNMFRKSAVTVNRIIEVDMMATPERERIYHNVIDKQRTSGRDLSQKETFDLYKAFLRLAEEDEGNAARDQVRIDKTTDEAQLEDLKRSGTYFERRSSFDTDSNQQLNGFRSTNRSASRYRESRFHEHGGRDDSEVSSAMY